MNKSVETQRMRAEAEARRNTKEQSHEEDEHPPPSGERLSFDYKNNVLRESSPKKPTMVSESEQNTRNTQAEWDAYDLDDRREYKGWPIYYWIGMAVGAIFILIGIVDWLFG